MPDDDKAIFILCAFLVMLGVTFAHYFISNHTGYINTGDPFITLVVTGLAWLTIGMAVVPIIYVADLLHLTRPMHTPPAAAPVQPVTPAALQQVPAPPPQIALPPSKKGG